MDWWTVDQMVVKSTTGVLNTFSTTIVYCLAKLFNLRRDIAGYIIAACWGRDIKIW